MTSISNNILSADSEKLLRTVFGTAWLEAWVCWKGNMYGKRVRDLKPGDLPDDADCYFSIALLRDSAVARTVEGVERVMAIVIDDVGTKIDKEAFDMFCPIEPTWYVETSEGNFQVGWAVKDGCTVDEYRAHRTKMSTHPVWGHSDAAMDPVHLYRLPQGTNTKSGRRVS